MLTLLRVRRKSAPVAPAGARRRFPPALKSGLLAAFIFLGDAATVQTMYSIALRQLYRACREPPDYESGGTGVRISSCAPDNKLKLLPFSLHRKNAPD